ncbi:MAG: DUF5688 family protein, partial [Eubacteriales bacterium]|nr:DUF5688 family protein [Eubacteriales bacterium]
PDAPRQFVITNEKKCRGAYAIAMPEVFEELANGVESDLVIIPSSIHELLVMPLVDVQENMTSADLMRMIREVNETQVPRKEWLSDRPYFYKRGSMQIEFFED